MYSSQTLVSDGTVTRVDLSIEYLSKEDIQVFVDDALLPTNGYAWTWASDTAINFNQPVSLGSVVNIRRTTAYDNIKHVFEVGGAVFKDRNVDENFRQVLYWCQDFIEGKSINDVWNNLNMHGNRILNLGNAVDPYDAVTLGQYQADAAGAWLAKRETDRIKEAAFDKLTTTQGYSDAMQLVLESNDTTLDVPFPDGSRVPTVAKRTVDLTSAVTSINGETGDVLVYKTFVDVAEMVATVPTQPSKVYRLHSYFAGKNSGGGDFYYDQSLQAVNNGITIFNGWVRIYDVLTFEMGGVLLNDKTNQASRMNSVLLFMEAEGIKEVKFAGSGVLWLGAAVKVPPRKVPSNRPVETGDDTRQWGYGNIAWQLDLSNVTFKPLVNDIELLVIHRDNVRLYGRYKAETGEDWGNLDGVGRKSGVTALRVGMLKAESDALNNAYYSLGTWFKADEVMVTGLQTAVNFQAGYAVFYPEITRLYARKTNYAVLFNSPDFDTYNQITRARIGYLQHEVGFCSLWGGCIETLVVDCYFGEDIKASKFTQPDPLSLISDNIATSFYFPAADRWGKINHKNMVLSGFLESADRLVVNNNYENEFRVKAVTVSQPSKGLVHSSGFGKESPIVEVNTLSGIQNYGNASLLVNITSDMIVNDPTIKLQLPDKNMPSLQGSLLLFPAELSEGTPWMRVEYLYVSTPATYRGLYFRMNNFRGNSPTDWIFSSDINYLNSDRNATNLKTLSVSIKNNNNTTRPNYIILGKYRDVAGDTDYNTGHDFISGKFVFMRGDKWITVSGQELQISLFQANGSLFGKLSTYNLFNRTTPVASQIDIIQYNNTKYIALKCANLNTLTTFAKYFSGESNMSNDDMFLTELDSNLVTVVEANKVALT